LRHGIGLEPIALTTNPSKSLDTSLAEDDDRDLAPTQPPENLAVEVEAGLGSLLSATATLRIVTDL
jgi:hypothetical protein